MPQADHYDSIKVELTLQNPVDLPPIAGPLEKKHQSLSLSLVIRKEAGFILCLRSAPPL